MSYCIQPDDPAILTKVTDSLRLSPEGRSLLIRSRISQIRIVPEERSCRIELMLPAKLPSADEEQVIIHLQSMLCIEKIAIEQIVHSADARIIENRREVIEKLANESVAVAKLLEKAEWKALGHRLQLSWCTAIEADYATRWGVANRLTDCFYERCGVILEQIELLHDGTETSDGCDFDPQVYIRDQESVQQGANKKNDIKPKETVVIGSLIKGTARSAGEIVEEEKNVILQGTVLEKDMRELKSGRFLLTFDLVDSQGALKCKVYAENKPEVIKKLSTIESGLSVKVKGTVMFDKYARELVLQADHIVLTEPESIMDFAAEKRVELHAHTHMSSLDSVASIEAIISTAAKWRHPAVALTDHGVVQAFPLAQELSRKHKVKVIYGMEGYLFDDDINQSFHIIILARTEIGLRNLYKLVSLSHLKHFRSKPRIPRRSLVEHRAGLLLGSACEAGELYQAVLNHSSSSEIEQIASFYDYLEIQPCGNNQFLVRDGKVPNGETLEKINCDIVALGDKLSIPVVATCDVHFLRPEDEVYRRILMSGQKYDDADLQPPVFFRTTEEMLSEFAYLGEEKARTVVIMNPVAIASQIADLKPIPDGLYSPEIPGADDDIRRMTYSKAAALYGDPLPQLIADRIKMELDSIINNGFGVLYLIAHKLVKKSLDDGYLVGSRGSVGSSLVATLTDITEVNPLPPHWRCESCKACEFADDKLFGSGFDLPDKTCPYCGTLMQKDGHNIPFAVFMGFEGDKVPDIDLNFSGEYQSAAHRYTEELFGRDNVFRAGTISTIAERTAYGFVQNYLEERKFPANSANVNRLVKGCAGVKRTTGQHPGGIMVVPRKMDIHHFSPIQFPADDRDSGKVTTHFDYHSISSRLVKLDILGHDDPTVIRMLEHLTGVDARTIPFDDPKTISLFSSTEGIELTQSQLKSPVATLGIPEFGTRFVRQMLEETRPKCFSELVRISGFSHGTDVWVNNAQDLIREKTASLSEAISARDDIMVTLIQQGVKPKAAFDIMESVRKGKGIKEPGVVMLRENNVPEWFIASCQKIQYMFPKAHAVAYVMMAVRIAWFKVHHPLAFYASYFTIRAEDFDPVAGAQGLNALDEVIASIESKGNEATVKDKAKLLVIETAREMVLRGFYFQPVNLLKSSADEFIIEKNSLLPPLAALPGLGAAAAQNIVQARQSKVFTSVEDLRIRSHISKSVIDILDSSGCLADLPASDQLRLFA